VTILRVIAGVLSSPLLLGFILAGVGLLLLRSPRRRAGTWLIATGAVLAYLASTSLVSDGLLAPLERKYPALDPTQVVIGVRDIVVLGSGYEPQEHIPATGALDADGLARIVEGVRLMRSRPDSRLLVSGGAPPGFAPSALGYARLATELGIPRSALIVLDSALDTSEEARAVVAVLGHTPFILVTSAYHMPRAMRLMRRAGADPIPAPTGQRLHTPRGARRFGLFPGSRDLRNTEIALHEYLGLAAVGLGVE
jgi:uncharacterized SAM-binding protein YcdF (DUF218 family)